MLVSWALRLPYSMKQQQRSCSRTDSLQPVYKVDTGQWQGNSLDQSTTKPGELLTSPLNPRPHQPSTFTLSFGPSYLPLSPVTPVGIKCLITISSRVADRPSVISTLQGCNIPPHCRPQEWGVQDWRLWSDCFDCIVFLASLQSTSRQYLQGRPRHVQAHSGRSRGGYSTNSECLVPVLVKTLPSLLPPDGRVHPRAPDPGGRGLPRLLLPAGRPVRHPTPVSGLAEVLGRPRGLLTPGARLWPAHQPSQVR